jgi:hypothetical protein
MNEEVTQPEYSTAVGLLVYAARARRLLPRGGAAGSIGAKLKSLFAGS